jgi:hypothetical protein
VEALISGASRPYPLDFMDVLTTDALPLIDYEVTDYFTLASSALGRFADLAHNPLQPILQRCFGTDLDMKQTGDLW